MQVHLIDGTYELFRSFYGAPSATAPDGREVGAVRGLLASLVSLLREPDVTHLGVAFDTVIESFRNELFHGYKTGLGIEPALWAQFPLAERAARALGLCTWSMVEFEADDALATMAVRAAAETRVARVLLATPDKDLAQMVRGERVVLLDRRKKVVLDEAAVRAKFGVGPSSIPDLLALVGDEQDGIPGVPRWGRKSAATGLAHDGHLEAIPAAPAAWSVEVRSAEALAASLTEHRDAAQLYKLLATLRTDVPLAESVDDLRWRGPAADLDALLGELAFERLRERVPPPAYRTCNTATLR
ncbi:MAG: flap endonuclease [Planctomycetes bacterium]|nr:flap endonuclease [Planctomycetota bacterium]